MKFLHSLAALRLAAALLCLLPSVAMAAGALPPYSPPQIQMEIGKPSAAVPFVLGCAGQSNASGYSYEGPKTVQSNILTVNDSANPTSIVPAAFGSPPYNLTSSANGNTTTNPALAYNNQCVWFANYLRLSGRLDASTPIIIVPNFFPGQPISQWVGSTPGSFTAGPYFTAFQSALNVVTADYPKAKLNFVIWDQGEYDNGGTPYSSQSLYTSAFQQLLAAWRTLPQWTVNTNVTMVELARFSDNALQGRNDAIDSFSCGALDPHVTVTPTAGALETTITATAGPHYHGASLAGLIAWNDFGAYIKGALNGSYHCDTNPKPQSVAITSGSLYLNSDYLRVPGAQISAGGGTIFLPDPSNFPGGTFAFIGVSAATGFSCNSANTSSPCIGGITTDNTAATTAPTISLLGPYLLFVSGGKWYLHSMGVLTGGFNPNTGTVSSSQTMTTAATRGSIFFYAGGLSITLPASNVSGQWFGGYVIGSATSATTFTTSDSSATIQMPDGSFSSTYTAVAGEYFEMKTIGGFWHIGFANLLSKVASVPSAGPGAGKCRESIVAGTNTGSCKKIIQCGTSATAVTVSDNVGSGC